jgi:hypothetical protein
MLKLAITLVIPYLILTRLGGITSLDPRLVLLFALAFPVAWMAAALARRVEIGITPAVGLISILLTAIIGTLANDPAWLAVKEASVPLVFGLAILASSRTSRPLVQLLVDRVVDTTTVRAALATRNADDRWQRLMTRATLAWSGALLVSAALNFALARIVVTSPAGTEAFNAELATMTALGLPVITLPMMVMMSATVWYIVHGVTSITGLAPREIARGPRLFERVDTLLRFLRLVPNRRAS